MTPNELLGRLQAIFELESEAMVAVAALAGSTATAAAYALWTQRPEQASGYQLCPEREVVLWLEGLIIHQRGRREEGESKTTTEQPLSHNLVLKKLKIALNLQTPAVLALLEQTGLQLSNYELGALFRHPDHKHYRPCSETVLRHFLAGVQLLRPVLFDRPFEGGVSG